MDKDEGSESARKIPGPAAAIVRLLNSRAHGPDSRFPDTLRTPEAAGAVLRPFGQPDTEAPSAERIAEVRALRATLMDLVSAPDAAGQAAARAELTERASSVILRQDFSIPGQVHLRQVDGDPVVGGITLAVAELLTDGTFTRLRACANEICGHVFYDTTRSRTQRWHAYEPCGNRNNVAAYRARRKADPGPGAAGRRG
ncbi:CGNR zinc finger domain-containing protein [Streptomyces chromofuscus]|uniref:CGNR zinc finger domain-containing protein n=1 Tax=Streptomyces chromofuscus TaxID=42881 RepID=UPI00167191B0|nr:CGNR zinc finger domain-containing protein [Streptomyces chromofuscus]GGT04699.1 hypothetical protein GCM10010254_26480 [Streptomyces chromofuscus]